MNGTDFSIRNLKRFVEVWFDEYKYLFYRNHPERLEIDHGDLSQAISLRKQLNCKSFKYYLERIAPKILKYFPIEKQPEFASGAIQSKANEGLCIETYGDYNQRIFLKECSSDLKNPSPKQDFILTWYRTIIRNMTNDDNCFGNDEFTGCLFEPGSQTFRYSLVDFIVIFIMSL